MYNYPLEMACHHCCNSIKPCSATEMVRQREVDGFTHRVLCTRWVLVLAMECPSLALDRLNVVLA